MTEAEWLASTDPNPMLEFLRDKASNRKLLLLACGCSRWVWHLLTDERSRHALEMAERYADGHVEEQELRRAVLAADRAAYRANRVVGQARTAQHAAVISQESVVRAVAKPKTTASQRTLKRVERAAQRAVERAERLAALAEETGMVREAVRSVALCVRAAWYSCTGKPGTELSLDQAASAATEAAGDLSRGLKSQCALLRCIFGPIPFRPVGIPSSVFAWNYSTISKIAQAIYDERRYQDLPILADALEDAGCQNADILAHCRQPGEHVRGCWVVDLLLGKS